MLSREEWMGHTRVADRVLELVFSKGTILIFNQLSKPHLDSRGSPEEYIEKMKREESRNLEKRNYQK